MTVVAYDVGVPMADGVLLRADVYRPSSGPGPFPVLLVRTPYGKQDPTILGVLDPLRATRAGFIVAIQDVRGRFASSGSWSPVINERSDGRDSARWAAGLPGSNGRVGTYGPSYLGQVQVANDSPLVAASVISYTWSNPADGLVARGGAAEVGLVTNWSLRLALDYLRRSGLSDAEVVRALDHFDADPLSAAKVLAALEMPVVAAVPPFGPPQRPLLIIAGWYDVFLQGSLDIYHRSDTASLIVGPWSHNNHTAQVGNRNAGLKADEGRLDLFGRQLDFLRDPPRRPEAQVFLTGVDEWRTYEKWPPPSRPHLFPVAGAFGFGPGDPVPTHGGNLLISPGFPPGPLDQARVESRPDVLVITGEPLTSDLEVQGRVTASIRATGSADLVVRLCDVDPDGVSLNLTDGIFRANGEAQREVDLWSIGHVFRAGHRIRVQITWSSFPRWDIVAHAKGPITIHPGSAVTLPNIG
ncbi:CocE/NonD family hydrolase [Actinoplanes sp. NPDC051411]|uniref:CocE/NonD family hydrolase n=1 Tax=Actinoplanes sp. NPDC051411 TaxID=3155522 RepID=UPI0034484511